ncbi:GTPase [Salegentibacter sediminis]|uniref:GTPase n=1 Tax=Salegentibacter sediminis TaxID=1930251 RepID=UPI0009C00A41|nr:GTPase [Salegentibacter sediminis]
MDKLIFVYNAFSGSHNLVLDSVLKLVGSKSQPCKLCELTHGVFSEKKAWKEFRKKSDLEMDFLHLDEFRKKYASKFGYKFIFPIVLWEDEREMGVFISTEELQGLENVQELIELIQSRNRR